jgi:hypothetical protein
MKPEGVQTMKTESELRQMLDRVLSMDCTKETDPRMMMFTKAAAAKTLLWALGENDDDRWYIQARPGPPVLAAARG